MRIERLWPLLVPALCVLALFASVAWLGMFRVMPDWVRFVALAAFAIGFVVALLPILRYRDPARQDVDRRLEISNELRHQPISMREDRLPDASDPVAHALWKEHRRRMAEGVGRVSGASPRPDMPARDPWALRALVPLAVVVAFAVSLGTGGGRLMDAFRPPAAAAAEVAGLRLDAWVTPPSYTGRPPIFLTREETALITASLGTEGEPPAPRLYTVPASSVVTLRVARGTGEEAVELRSTDGSIVTIEPVAPDAAQTGDGASAPAAVTDPDAARVYEVELQADATVVATLDGSESLFAFAVMPDTPPSIAWRENDEGEVHETTRTGALTLHYEAEDDYALDGGTAEIAPLRVGEGDARPLFDLPEFVLAMPRANAKSPAAKSTRDLTEHPFAGAVTDMILVARDKAGQEARSETRRIVLPEREFRDPLALAILDQRRSLAMDAGAVPTVLAALDLILLHAETTVDDTPHYLGLVSARGRVASAADDDALRDAVAYMWELARGIEDGAISSAERRLRDAQDALAEALENEATDEEIAELMDELREAMREFMEMMAERMQDMPQQAMPIPPNMQFMDQNDIERMLDNMEEMARSGQRDQAQAMLDELRRMMDQLQAGTPQQGEMSEQQAEMQRQMQEMGDLLREQQELMDETFRMEGSRPPPSMGEQDPQQFGDQSPRQSPQPGQQPPQSFGDQQPPRGQQDQQQDQAEGQQGQQGERPQAGEPMTPEEFAEAMDELRQRQEELQQRLEQLQEDMEAQGMEAPEQFGEAGDAMGDAEGDLGEGQSGAAVDDQGRAIEALRQGAQNAMEQMMQAMQGQGPGMMQPGMMPGQQQGGRPGPNNPFNQGMGQTREDRDPLGRPRATQGPQFGDEIEVPDEIDTQRARRILDAIRERLGKQLTPKLEREYLERLLDLQ